MPYIDRRRFLQSGALGLAAAAGLECQPSLLADPLGLPVGLQIYTVADACQKDLPGALRRVVQVGYREVELARYDELLERADPKCVDMEMDCFWTTMAGHDPVNVATGPRKESHHEGNSNFGADEI